MYIYIWQLLFFVGPPISFTKHNATPPRRIHGSMGQGSRKGSFKALMMRLVAFGSTSTLAWRFLGSTRQAVFSTMEGLAWSKAKFHFGLGKEARFFPCTKWWQWSCLNRLGSCVVGKVFEFVWLPNGGGLLRRWNRYHIYVPSIKENSILYFDTGVENPLFFAQCYVPWLLHGYYAIVKLPEGTTVQRGQKYDFWLFTSFQEETTNINGLPLPRDELA